MTTPAAPTADIDPMLAPMLVRTSGEREVLAAFLDFHRDIVLRKIAGLSDEDVHRRLLPSRTTLGGLLKHLALVERNWFSRLLSADPTSYEQSGEGSWSLDDRDTIEALAADYRAACEESRAAAARFPLDHVVVHPQIGEISLRWIHVHLIEETARHAGHADIVRELTDGSTGALG